MRIDNCRMLCSRWFVCGHARVCMYVCVCVLVLVCVLVCVCVCVCDTLHACFFKNLFLTGCHCEKVLEIGMRSNLGLLCIYDEAGTEMENCEVLLTDQGLLNIQMLVFFLFFFLVRFKKFLFFPLSPQQTFACTQDSMCSAHTAMDTFLTHLWCGWSSSRPFYKATRFLALSFPRTFPTPRPIPCFAEHFPAARPMEVH